jgi:hypothetical protein
MSRRETKRVSEIVMQNEEERKENHVVSCPVAFIHLCIEEEYDDIDETRKVVVTANKTSSERRGIPTSKMLMK